ncbi:unnamed protein product, partial [Mesorhabditis belari]|uniref:Zinc metalloproteinase n=1 Tax=Mesorhabditis belari TaxID=2138241 RepID=A0AAF3ENR4_9BILA
MQQMILASVVAFLASIAASDSGWGTMTAAQIDQFKQSLGETDVNKFDAALARARAAAAAEEIPESRPGVDEPIIVPKTKSNLAEDTISQINTKTGVAPHLYHGDMILTNKQIDVVMPASGAASRKKRQAQWPAELWAGRTVYYTFATGAAALSARAKQVALLGIDQWRKATCISFVQSATAKNRIRFFKGDGCYSNVGMTGGVQDLSLGDGCETIGHAAHELGHALGFWHTQSRWDRDTFLNVILARIPAQWRDQFSKETSATNHNYGVTYDYGSIMHYDGRELSSTNQYYALTKLAPTYQDNIGSYILSFNEIVMMNAHYGCPTKCTSGATCLNGGIRNPRACNQCLCPSGWAGTQCAARPAGCGAALTATAAAQTTTIAAGSASMGQTNAFAMCNYLIRAPAGKKVQIVLTTLTNNECVDGCYHGGIEIKAMSDHRYTGIRKCCAEDKGTAIVSQGNVVPIIAFSRLNRPTTTITYKWVEATVVSTVTTAKIAGTKITY